MQGNCPVGPVLPKLGDHKASSLLVNIVHTIQDRILSQNIVLLKHSYQKIPCNNLFINLPSVISIHNKEHMATFFCLT